MFNRRQFLEDSILAATAALAGPALAASAAEESKKASANERLSVAVIGTGVRGPVHAGAFAGRGDCDVVAICDADISRARTVPPWGSANGASYSSDRPLGVEPSVV